jgi:hypothetical protein
VSAGTSDPAAIARSVLSERRFHPPPVPRPLHGVVDWISNAVTSVVDSVSHALDSLGSNLWLLIGALLAVAALTGVIARRALRRRQLVSRAAAARLGAAGPGARELDRAADAAERAGRRGEALRLRYRAGLVALAERGLLEQRPSLLAGEARERLSGERFAGLFERLTQGFELVAYGGSEPDGDAVTRAREDWAALLAQAGGSRARPAGTAP